MLVLIVAETSARTRCRQCLSAMPVTAARAGASLSPMQCNQPCPARPNPRQPCPSGPQLSATYNQLRSPALKANAVGMMSREVRATSRGQTVWTRSAAGDPSGVQRRRLCALLLRPATWCRALVSSDDPGWSVRAGLAGARCGIDRGSRVLCCSRIPRRTPNYVRSGRDSLLAGSCRPGRGLTANGGVDPREALRRHRT